MSLPHSRFASALLLGLVVLLPGCNDSNVTAPAATTPPAARAEPDYWPTTDWQTATPEAQGFAAGAFDTLAADAATALPYHTSLLVIRDGWLVHEHYNDPPSGAIITADTKHHVWSVTKSVTSLTVGRAITQGHLLMSDLDATVEGAFPASIVATLPAADGRRGIRLRDVLEMRSGLAWNEVAWLLSATRDPIFQASSRMPPCPADSTFLACSILQQPLAYTPGTTWNYSTYDSYLISAFFSEILTNRFSLGSRVTLSDYAGLYLFPSLGIPFATTDWSNMTSAYTFGGGLLSIRSRDLAKLGMLMQYEGRWEDEQLISPEWMDLSIAELGNTQVPVFDSNGEPAGSSTMDVPYSLQWWRTTELGFGGPAAISARGMGGQKVQVFRDKGLVIVITCGDVTAGDPGLATREAEINTFLQTHVLDKLVN